MIIRPAIDSDAPAIIALWNPQIRDTTITVSSEERTADDVRQMIASRRAAGTEFFVAEEQAGLLGLVTYRQFRPGNGYAHSMEHTIIIAPGAWGRGVGRALMTTLEDHARSMGGHTMVAVVTAENDRALAFHRALGYVDVGFLPEQGRKFDRWLDLVFLQKIL
jgi:phosphinothricin acetyltransferase